MLCCSGEHYRAIMALLFGMVIGIVPKFYSAMLQPAHYLKVNVMGLEIFYVKVI